MLCVWKLYNCLTQNIMLQKRLRKDSRVERTKNVDYKRCYVYGYSWNIFPLYLINIW